MLLMVGQCYPSPRSALLQHDAKTKAARLLTERTDWMPSFPSSLHCQRLRVNSVGQTGLEKEPDSMPNTQQRRRETSSFTPPLFNFGGCAVFVQAHPLDRKKKKKSE
jgi:hypothetical protein